MKKNLLIVFLLSVNLNFGSTKQPVILIDNGETVVLSNEFIKATISKKSATITSILYKGLEMMGKQHPHWNIVGSDDNDEIKKFSKNVSYVVITDPTKNNGERVEISIKYRYEADTSTIPLDVDLRFALDRNNNGIYLSGFWKHGKDYPSYTLGQARMLFVLNPGLFDFYTVDANRRRVMATGNDVKNGIKLNVKEAKRLTTGVRKGEVEHKYDYSAMLAQTPTWGWTSKQKHIGAWMINASCEYINGGPTQIGNTGHVETILMNHWQDGHYGGGALQLEKDEAWEKFAGPFFLYFNSGKTHDLMWNDALAEASKQRSLWPYSWVKAMEYPSKEQRGKVSGQIAVTDPYLSKTNFSNMWVGLAYPGDERDPTIIENKNANWQYEHKHYQFWIKADSLGNFVIPNIREGKYTLYAFADGILGEFQKPDITVAPGSNTDLGKLIFKPLRYGKQLWEIGIPNRSASEFKHGDHYWQWGLYLLYPKEFPNDVNYTIGKSDWSKDWNYCQPSVIDPTTYQSIRGTKWSINFDQPEYSAGKATLRLAFCGSRRDEIINVSVNGNVIGNAGPLPNMGVMHRDGIRGKQDEYALSFDAKLLKKGNNTITLNLKARNWTFGVLYDYLRLELEENK